MNKNFRYIKKNGNFICENDYFKVEYSKPLLKGTGYSSIKTLDDIENCTYIMKLFKSINGKWRLLNSKEADGFGIFDFQKLIYDMIHKKRFGCQKEIDETGNTTYSYKQESSTFESYEMIKYWYSDNTILFSLYIGLPMNEDISEGIYVKNLTYDDILVWKKFVNEFIDYAIMIQNQKVRTYNKFHSKCYKLKEGRVYYYDIEDMRKINNIYTENEDVFDVIELSFIDKETFTSKLHSGVTIEKVTEKEMTLSNGSKIKAGRIQNMKRYLDDEDDRYAFGVNGVANDLIYAITVKDRDDFTTLSKEDLLVKYGETILNRTVVGSEKHQVSDTLDVFQDKVMDKIIQKLS